MLKLRVSGNKNDLKTFKKWFENYAKSKKSKFELGEEKLQY